MKSSKSLRDRLRHAFQSGNWFMYPRLFLAAMDFDMASVLSYLINQGERRQCQDSDDWFDCSLDQMREDLFCPYRKQNRAIHKLVEAGFVEVRRVGWPSRRQFRVVANVLRDRIEEELGKWQKRKRSTLDDPVQSRLDDPVQSDPI